MDGRTDKKDKRRNAKVCHVPPIWGVALTFFTVSILFLFFFVNRELFL